MKKTKIFLKMAALAVMGTMMSGCAEEIETLQPANQSAVQKITISLADDAGTRGTIASDGKTSFSAGDQIAVIYQNTDGKTLKAVSAALTSADLTDEGASATFTVELNSPKAETKVRYIYPASMAAATLAEDASPDAAATVNTTGLATQDGTLATIASDLGLSVYDGTMSATATLPTGSGVILENQLAIVKLNSIKITADTELRSEIASLTVADGTNTYTINRTAEDAPIFVAMLPTSGDITFSTINNGYGYTNTATGKTLAKNKIYPINLMLAQDMRATPLTFEADEDNNYVKWLNICTDAATNPIYYRQYDCNTEVWTDWAVCTVGTKITMQNSGDKVQFKAENATYATSQAYSNIDCGKCYVYGNIMSLTDGDRFFTADELKGSYTFSSLFQESLIQFDSSRPLLLPATKLKESCYRNMFECCSKLTSAPDLPAMELKAYCYKEMFSGCSNLSSVKCYATDISATDCLNNWLDKAGTDASIDLLVFVDQSMENVGTSDTSGQWCLATSGKDGKRWRLELIPQ